MFKRLRYILVLVLVLLLLQCTQAVAQIAMPDTVCIGTTRVYQVNTPATPSTYTWQVNGVTQSSTTNQISIMWNTAGIYQLTVQEHALNGCDGDIRSGLVHVNPVPVPNAGPDKVLCYGVPHFLNGSGGVTYQWTPATNLSNPNVASPLFSTTVPGVYTYLLDVTLPGGCQPLHKDTVVFTVLPPLKVFAGNDTAVIINQPFGLNAVDIGNSGFVNYLWTPSFGLSNPGIPNPTATLNREITYTVIASNAYGCRATDGIKIKVFERADIYVPNAFTPGGDWLNDIFRPILVGIKQLKYFSVYNRYGQLIYTTNVQGRGWNGTYNGAKQNQGTYVWDAEAVDFKGEVIHRKGTVILIR
jgi:gliding motility-associated-like protein